MKKLIFTLLISLFALNVVAQKDVTKFLGIPVDGTKAEMIRKLKAKGFKSTTYDREILEGEFNGYDVTVHIATTNNKVSRIMVCDKNNVNESTIRIRFNNLCHQFNNNGKYIAYNNFTIPDSEDISYNMSINNKRYEAIFYQLIDNHREIASTELSSSKLSITILPTAFFRAYLNSSSVLLLPWKKICLGSKSAEIAV